MALSPEEHQHNFLVAALAFAKWIEAPIKDIKQKEWLDQPWAYALGGLGEFLTDVAAVPTIKMELAFRAEGGRLVEAVLKHTDTGDIRLRVILNADGSRTIVKKEGI